MNFKGKEYTEVKDRITAFRKDHPKWSITTSLEWHNEDMSAVLFKALVSSSIDEDGDLQQFAGWAYEERIKTASKRPDGSTYYEVNYTSWVENAETSAIGRALANMGYQGSAERPSAEEMAKVDRMTNAHPGASLAQPGASTGAPRQDAPPPTDPPPIKAKTIGTKRRLLDKISADAKRLKEIVGHDKYFQQALANRNVSTMEELPYGKLAELEESFGAFVEQTAGIQREFEEKDPEWKVKLAEIADKMCLLL